MRHLVADWQVNVIAYWQSGSAVYRVQHDGAKQHRASVDLPDQTCSDTGRNNLYGPPRRRIDMSLFKDVAITTHRLQLRIEVFNLTNAPSFAVPEGGLGSATLARSRQPVTIILRQFRFAAKYLF